MMTKPLDTPPGLELKPSDINEGNPTKANDEQRWLDDTDLGLVSFWLTGGNEYPFIGISQPESDKERVFGDHIHIEFLHGGKSLAVSCEQAELIEAKDLEGKKCLVRKKKIGRSAENEPIFPSFHLPVWKFVELYVPAPESRCRKSEWVQAVSEIQARLDVHKQLELGNAEFQKAESEKRARAAIAAENPTAALAAGIAAGVAEALKSLGIEPKKSAKA
jgi:hypothetical protein